MMLRIPIAMILNPMKFIENQLNKVKHTYEKGLFLDAAATRSFLEFVLAEEGSLRCRSVLVLNSESGILQVAAGLLDAGQIVSIAPKAPGEATKATITQFQTDCNFIVSRKSPFRERCVDLAVIGPPADKNNQTELSQVKLAMQMAKSIYFLFLHDHKKLLQEKLIGCDILGSIKLQPPAAAHYSKGAGSGLEYLVGRVFGPVHH